MNRLTDHHYNGDGAYMVCSGTCYSDAEICGSCPELEKIIDRLAAYEDTGLEPTEIEQLKYCYTNLEKDVDSFGGSFYRARNLLKAEAEGRLYVLPRAGDVTVERDGLQYIGDHWNPPVLTAFADDPTTRSGKRVGFISPRDAEEAVRTKQEEAEAALRKEQG